MEGDPRNTILDRIIVTENYSLPSFSESFMDSAIARDVTCKLVGHDWVTLNKERFFNERNCEERLVEKKMCMHCHLVRTEEQIINRHY